MTARVKLTALDVEVLRAAARNDGRLYRQERYGTNQQSYLDEPYNGRTNVTRNVDKLTSAPKPLLTIGETDGVYRPWLLTDAGRDALDNADKKATR
jgi:hypothetical protein